jgi:Glutamine amidotransferase class-I
MPTPHDQAAQVLVLQHLPDDGPGYLGRWLDFQKISWHVFCADAGEAYPASVGDYRAMAVLGGEWSANDERPSLRHAEALIREADALGIPIIGHCLGGQLMARAFGGKVERAAQPEIGWMPLQTTGSEAARYWFGEHSTAGTGDSGSDSGRSTGHCKPHRKVHRAHGLPMAPRQLCHAATGRRTASVFCRLPAPSLCTGPTFGHAVPYRNHYRKNRPVDGPARHILS